jgi:hypothetical protein
MLPVVMLMAVVASAGVWFAVREASNAPQAAEPATIAAPAVTPAALHGTSSAPKPANAGHEAPAAEPKAPEAPANGPKPVSITGCVQKADDGFVLRNTEGSEAPRSRSWKSGFLHRGAASVTLSDPGNTSHLSSHVGQRVSVTGALVDRDMHVLSLRRLSASCQ